MAYAKPGVPGLCPTPYRDVQHGDIVVFRYPEDTHRTYVKRAIGLPGDRIRLCRANAGDRGKSFPGFAIADAFKPASWQ